MNNFSLRIIPIVHAQSIDAIAQPSFGTLSNGGIPIDNSLVKIDLESQKTTFGIGETFKVKVKLVSQDDLFIDKISLRILYNPNLLSVVDSDPNTTGTQIKILNSNLTLANQNDNNVNALEGIITLIVNVENNINFKGSTEIAEITFNTQAQGLNRIAVQTGSNGTRLIKDSLSIGYTASELQVNITNIKITQSVLPTLTNTPTPMPTSLTTPTVTPVQINNQTNIPNTSVSKELVDILVNLFFGILVVLTGLNIFLKAKKRKK
ncbi:MAG: hypothetical protein NZZ41_03835 [Candidatus Dojkabacteria bacterium]|nr:hypothetical protein [Candidatus Dojkabacteria bacterium]